MIAYRRATNGIVIVLLASTVAFISLFTYAQFHLKDKLTINFVQHAEIEATLLEQATSLWLKSGHTTGLDMDLMELRATLGLSEHIIFNTEGLSVFPKNSDLPALPMQASTVAKVIKQDQHIDIFNYEQKLFSRFSPIRKESRCIACHDTAGNVLGVIRADFKIEDEFELLDWISNLIWGLAGIMILTIAGLAISIVVIKEKKKFASQLHEAKESLQMILDYSKAIIITTDIEGRVVEFNREAELLSGYGKKDVVGRRLLSLCADTKQRAEIIQSMQQAMADTGQSWEVRNKEVEIITSVGKEIFVNATYSPLKSDSKTVGIVVVCKDVTEHLGLQMKLIQSEKLAGIGTLASGVAHEINNPLAGILGMAEAARDEEDQSLCKDYLNLIISYTLNASDIVKELTAYSRSASAHELSKIDLSAIMLDSLKMAAHSAPLSSIKVHRQLKPNCYIHGNAGELQQVFVNLIINSIHAMGDNGDLTLKCWHRQGRIFARVTDTGIGIPAKFINRIHDPFFTSKPASKGTGLGLYVVYKIVTKFDGSFDCESTEGRGTSMTLEFPEVKKPKALEGEV